MDINSPVQIPPLPYSPIALSDDVLVDIYDPTALINAPVELVWLVPFLIQNPGLIMCVGPSKIGKTTFLVKLALCLSKGDTFLEEKCIQSRVLYVALEGGLGSAKKTFMQLGLKETDDLRLVIDRPENKLPSSENLVSLIKRTNARVVIIDSLMLWEKTFNENAYGETYEVLRRYTKIAKEMDVTVIFTHHSPKSALEGSGGGDGALGSTAFFGAVDTKIQLLRVFGVPHLKIDHRNEESFEPKPIFMDRQTGTVSLSRPVLSPAETRIREEIINLMSASTVPVRDSDIKSAISGKAASKIKVLDILCSEGVLFKNDDKPVTYFYSGSFNLIPEDIFTSKDELIENWSPEQLDDYIKYMDGESVDDSRFPSLGLQKKGIEL